MKRRLFTLVLMLSMLFSLCACGPTVGIKQSVQEGEEKLASVENCHLVLRLTVNPQLELYLDETGTVLKAAAGNEDGESLLAALELTGLGYADAVSAILSGAQEQDLLAENANVQIDVLASADGPLTFEQTQQLEQAVTDYDEDLSSSVDQSIVVAADCGADSIRVDELENGDLFYDFYSGNIAIRQVCYGADGSYTEWVYQPWGITSLTTDVISIDPDGTRHEEHMAYEDGVQTYHQNIIQQGDYTETEEAWYEDGCTSHTTLQDSDGYYEERTYYSNGNTKTQKNAWTDGSYGEFTFYANGNPETEEYTSADGMVRERSYYENGNIKTEEEHYPNGENYVYRHTTYEEDGSCHIIEKTKDGTTQEYFLDKDGLPIDD